MDGTPIPVVHEERVRANIRRMHLKAAASGLRFRPHFKTHCSREIGRWFRESGVEAITVSSPAMARYFALDGWRDITIAFVTGPHEAREIDELRGTCNIGVLCDSPEAVTGLDASLTGHVDLWLKTDCGYGRTGVRWDDAGGLERFCRASSSASRLGLRGILTHSGDSYHAGGREGILEVHRTAMARMAEAAAVVEAVTGRRCEVSTGDTPTCSLAESFPGVDEIRPGNFVFFDAMQLAAGACAGGDLAFAIRAVVAGVYPDRGQAVLRCGAVHMSKDSFLMRGRRLFGLGALPSGGFAGPPEESLPVVGLSQEHALMETSGGSDIRPGMEVFVYPAHSCLAAACFSFYLSGDRKLDRMV